MLRQRSVQQSKPKPSIKEERLEADIESLKKENAALQKAQLQHKTTIQEQANKIAQSGAENSALKAQNAAFVELEAQHQALATQQAVKEAELLQITYQQKKDALAQMLKEQEILKTTAKLDEAKASLDAKELILQALIKTIEQQRQEFDEEQKQFTFAQEKAFEAHLEVMLDIKVQFSTLEQQKDEFAEAQMQFAREQAEAAEAHRVAMKWTSRLGEQAEALNAREVSLNDREEVLNTKMVAQEALAKMQAIRAEELDSQTLELARMKKEGAVLTLNDDGLVESGDEQSEDELAATITTSNEIVSALPSLDKGPTAQLDNKVVAAQSNTLNAADFHQLMKDLSPILAAAETETSAHASPSILYSAINLVTAPVVSGIGRFFGSANTTTPKNAGVILPDNLAPNAAVEALSVAPSDMITDPTAASAIASDIVQLIALEARGQQ